MKYNPDKHHRQSIRLEGYDYSQPGAYFITICTQVRDNIFGEIVDGKMVLNEYGRIVQKNWLEIPNYFGNVQLNEFIIMPDHFHGIVMITQTNKWTIPVGAIHELPLRELPIYNQKQRRKMTIPLIVGRFKMNSTKQINVLRNLFSVPIWQRNYYDEIISNEKQLIETREYIINNPIKWQLDKENPMNLTTP